MMQIAAARLSIPPMGSWQTRLFFWFAATMAVQAALTHNPAPFVPHIWDKYQHGLGFAALTAAALCAYPRTSLLRLTERMALFGAMIEVVQSAPFIGRDCDLADWVADMVAVGAVLAVVWISRKSLREPKPK